MPFLTSVQRFFGNLLRICLFALAFFLPFEPRFLAIIYIAAVVSFLFHKNFKEIFNNLKSYKRQIFLFLAFLGAHAISLLWSDDFDAGHQSLDPKMAFLLVPAIFYGSRFKKDFSKQLLKIFIISTLLSMLICSVLAIYYYSTTQNPELLYYSEFSRFMHVGYISMYLNFCLIFSLEFFFSRQSLFIQKSRIDVIIVIGLSLLFQFIVANKTGIITSILILLGSIGFHFWKNRKYILLIISIISTIALPVMIVFLIPGLNARLNQTMKEFRGESLTINEAQSINIRKQIWHEAVSLIAEKPILGHGIGDVNDELMQRYEQKQIKFAQKEHLNAHNQFLQTWLGAGIPGTIALILLFSMFYPLKKFNHPVIFIGFLAIIFIMMLTESIFERQAATVFFALISCLLTMSFSKNPEP